MGHDVGRVSAAFIAVLVVVTIAVIVTRAPGPARSTAGAGAGAGAVAAPTRATPDPATSPLPARSTATTAVLPTSTATTAVLPTSTAPADPALRERVAKAAAVASSAGLRAGIAILNLRTGAYYGAGDDTSLFGSGSVMKVLIATELLATGQMHGATERTAYSMITRSDDGAANKLWWAVGGTDVINRIAERYHLPDLGQPNTRSGFWGNTHITAKGMVQLYRRVLSDQVVGPWLYNAMRHMARYGLDGTDQYFGIPSAASDFAVKQGWASLSADDPDDAIVNTTGYVDHARYAVAILTEGHHNDGGCDSRGYNHMQGKIVSTMARILMPKGRMS